MHIHLARRPTRGAHQALERHGRSAPGDLLPVLRRAPRRDRRTCPPVMSDKRRCCELQRRALVARGWHVADGDNASSRTSEGANQLALRVRAGRTGPDARWHWSSWPCDVTFTKEYA